MTAARRFILVPAASAGDVHPFLWLALHLQAAGHDVVAVVHEPFGSAFAAAGVRAVVYGSTSEYDLLLRHPDLWHPQRGFALIARTVERAYRHAVPRIQTEIREGLTTLVGAGPALAARIAAEAFDLPLVTIQIQPATFCSIAAPPVLRAGWEWFPSSPRWVRRIGYRLAWWKADWLLAEDLNAFRAELGLSGRVQRVLDAYWLSPQRVIALFPEWFASPAPDWPPQTILTRFPLHDGAGASIGPELESYLQSGPAPLAFAPSPANRQAANFFRAALAACLTLNARAVFLTPFREQLPPDLPASIRWFPAAPLGQLLPRCRALVHHGAIGTAAQGLAAGIPQLVVPLSHDQPDNACRLRRLGVAESLYPKRFTPPAAAELLSHLAGSKDVARACRDARERVRQQMPPSSVASLVAEIA